MRPIKFRAWETEKKEMWEPWNPYITQFQACEIADKLTAGRFLSLQESHPYIFQQFTWLKDKNEKMIFEWDIVIGIKWDERAPRYEVYFDDEILAYFVRNTKTKFYLCDLREVEIIWSIYESPELLYN